MTMKAAIDTRMESTGRASFALATLTCLCVVAFLATPASSDEVPTDPTPVPAGQPSVTAQPSVEAQPQANTCGNNEGVPARHGPCADVDPKGNMDHNRPEHGSLSNIGAKLTDPTSDIWALQFNIQGPTFYDGDLNSGDPKVGANVIFQPILPFPLYGTGENSWKLITRPIIPIVFSQPIPKSPFMDDFKSVGGLGDIEIPLLVNLPTSISGHWILGAGPVFEFPTSTNDALGAQQYSIGPALVAGYKTKKWLALVFPNYFFGVGDRSDRKSTTPTTSKLSLLYVFSYNLPQAWQVGFNPTISYNHKAASGNKWDVPVGLFAGKMIRVGRVPVKIHAIAEYSVVSPDAFGKRFGFRFEITPVIPGLVQKPIFGGK